MGCEKAESHKQVSAGDDRQHNVEDDAPLYQRQRAGQAGLGGGFVRHGGRAAGQAGQQQGGQHGQEISPLQAVQGLVMGGGSQQAASHGQQAAQDGRRRAKPRSLPVGSLPFWAGSAA